MITLFYNCRSLLHCDENSKTLGSKKIFNKVDTLTSIINYWLKQRLYL